ncbi:hypothetical protein RR11_310 [Ruegeria sp. R11]|nr:hypothetical protein RR11_310 [Ruegeria sp. R11]
MSAPIPHHSGPAAIHRPGGCEICTANQIGDVDKMNAPTIRLTPVASLSGLARLCAPIRA